MHSGKKSTKIFFLKSFFVLFHDCDKSKLLSFSLNVPGELLKAVYAAASTLRLDRAANECARFMAR